MFPTGVNVLNMSKLNFFLNNFEFLNLEIFIFVHMI